MHGLAMDDARLGTALYYSMPDEAGNVMVISDLAHDECGWPERVTYLAPNGDVVRSGCAGCEVELPVPDGAARG